MPVTLPEEFRRLLDAADRWEEERDALMWAVADSLPAYLDLAEAASYLDAAYEAGDDLAESWDALRAALARVESK